MKRNLCLFLAAGLLLMSAGCAGASQNNISEASETETGQPTESGTVGTMVSGHGLSSQQTMMAVPAVDSAAREEEDVAEVLLYLPNENADGFDTMPAFFDGTADALVELLVENGVLSEGCSLVDFSVVEDRSEAVLNMNVEFGAAMNVSGTAGEQMMIGALVNTFLNYYGLSEVTVLVEGRVLETGHMRYDVPLTFSAD